MTEYNTDKLKMKVIPVGLATDIRGSKYGRLTVKDRVESDNTQTKWATRCDCGGVKIVDGRSLKAGHTKSCGCLHKEVATRLGRKAATDLVGKRYGRLTVIRPTKKRSGGSIVWECECDCGETTLVNTNHLNRRNIRSCGCLLLEQKGEGHYAWKPELTAKDREARVLQSTKSTKWRDQVYERDEYTCQLCEEIGGRLNAHHLNGWDKHKEERFDVGNGVTLCEKCHIKFHKEYGYGNNTREQFDKYIEVVKNRVDR